MPRRRVVTVTNVLLALIGTLMIFCAAVVIVLNLRQIYYFDIKFLDLKEKVGLDDWIIQRNYDTLIDYNLVTKQVAQLRFPSFRMSDAGRIHFEEVRQIFYVIQYAGMASIVLFVLGMLRKIYRRDYGCLKLMSVLSLVIPIVLGVAVVLDWERFFIGFHRLVFSNDYWIFDPATDPVIDILPDEFFLHCAAAVLVFIVLGSIISGVLYRVATRRRRRR
jgi:integral membrane protein (TIGR01906 family)